LGIAEVAIDRIAMQELNSLTLITIFTSSGPDIGDSADQCFERGQ